jgi:hypothetical protein
VPAGSASTIVPPRTFRGGTSSVGRRGAGVRPARRATTAGGHRPGHDPGFQPLDDLDDARVADVGHEDGPRDGSPACLQPGLETVDDGAPIGEHVWVIPLRRGQDRTSGRYGVEVARIFVRLDHERAPVPSARLNGRPAGQSRRQQSAPTKAHGSRPGLDQDVNQPARRGALAVRAGHAHERLPDCGVGDDLLPRLERHRLRPGPRPARRCPGRSP